MTDINGVSAINPKQPTPGLVKNAITIVEVPITMPPERNVFEVRLREPGTVRAVGYWLHEPKVVASAMRGIQAIAMPLLFVECNPQAPLLERSRVFAFLPSGAEFEPRPGLLARYVTTAMHAKGAMHLFELVSVEAS